MTPLSEATVESSALQWFSELGYQVLHGPDIAPDSASPERESYYEVLLSNRLHEALSRINADLPQDALDEAFRKLTTPQYPSLHQNNRAFHLMLANGVEVAYRKQDGSQGFTVVKLVDFEDPEQNDFVACNQFTVLEGKENRRPDTLVFVNGLPIAILEFKNPNSNKATLADAFNQLQTYKTQLSQLFTYNELLVISDGIEARMGSLTSPSERFMPWKTIDGTKLAENYQLGLDVLLKGVFAPIRLLAFLHHFILFEEDSSGSLSKKLGGYHQFHAVQKAVTATILASQNEGNRKAGVVWHTQGSGKSLTMVFYAGALMTHPEMGNPTLVVITDRNDLDEQLFSTFAKNKDLLRQTPARAENRDHLRVLLQVSSGGVVFTTIQKFLPEEKGARFSTLSERKNIVVIADEAHRTQYGFREKLDASSGHVNVGFAQHLRDALPHASFIGFTGTPVEMGDKNTRAVFGDYIDVYDIQQAVEDKATVPIYYESRLAKLKLKIEKSQVLDPEFDRMTEGEEESHKEKLKSKWTQLEALVGAESRIAEVALDLISHFELRQNTLDGGKGMIVCMSRRICQLLYTAMIKLRPNWHGKGDTEGRLKVIMTGSASDRPEFQPHIRSKTRLTDLANRFRDPADPFQLVIVRDMWLTGFDAPCLHTLYVDKPMQSHSLMQAIARVNRVFTNKPGGLVVDYLGIADQLKSALNTYTASEGRGSLYIDQEEALDVMEAKYEIVCQMFHGFNWKIPWIKGAPAERLGLLPHAQEHILAQPEGKARYLKAAAALSKAYSLVASHEAAMEIRTDLAFFSAIRHVLVRPTQLGVTTQSDMEYALRQLVSEAVASDGMLDVFSAAGLEKPKLSVLSDQFLAEIRNLPQKNLAVELLARLLQDEIKVRTKNNLVQSKSFSHMLEQSLKKYQNRTIEASQVIEELIAMAKDFYAAIQRGEELGLTSDETAFYDALEVNDSAVKILGDHILTTIARDLVREIRGSLSIDWNVKESIRAAMRIKIKRLLRKYGYPPDKQERATNTVLQQAELLCGDWST